MQTRSTRNDPLEVFNRALERRSHDFVWVHERPCQIVEPDQERVAQFG